MLTISLVVVLVRVAALVHLLLIIFVRGDALAQLPLVRPITANIIQVEIWAFLLVRFSKHYRKYFDGMQCILSLKNEKRCCNTVSSLNITSQESLVPL